MISSCPTLLRYRTHAEKGSLYHTPNTLGIYAVGEVARWVNQSGGLDYFEERSRERAERVYKVIDAFPDIYQGHAERTSRSYMNLTFRMLSRELEEALLSRASDLGMIGLRGHRSVGGLRASLYNAVSDESVSRLITLLEEVARSRGRSDQ
jgi:phosphoserine aminotransferase